MSRKEQLIKEIEANFEIEASFCHEGDVRLYCDEPDLTQKTIKFQVRGSSIMEHSGDEDSVHSNVHDLIGTKSTFSFEGKDYTAKVKSATVELKGGGAHDDGDYEMSIKGEFVLELI